MSKGYVLKKKWSLYKQKKEEGRTIWTKIYKGDEYSFKNILEAIDFFVSIEPNFINNK